MTKKTTLLAGVILAVSAIASTAAADPTKHDDTYGYTFKDDLLQGDAKGALAAQIRVLPKGRRDLLLRPRVHFVPEMLKSVENM